MVGVAALLSAPAHARAQEPTAPANIPEAHSIGTRIHRWWNCFSANDGIPRTYSYYYTYPLNQPRHFRVVGPDGRMYWTSTVRGMPMGWQWLTD
jgi:hypothetical protein